MVQPGVDGDRPLRERVDVRGHDGGGPGLGRSNRGNPRARAEVHHPPALNQVRVIEQVAGHRLAAGPAEGPIGTQPGVVEEVLVRGVPQRRVGPEQS